ncbi:MAG: DNA-directed RNA polymerase subunit D [Methanobacterium sp.]|jgi:DNA-directed RNA polymerase subunit D|nr:DNA-directed RNA polymerase subunit D [Methanobacterium sp.]
MDIHIKSSDDQKMVLVIEGVDVPFINALRRICTVEVPSMAIDQVDIIMNDSRIFDEVLAHRLGLVPLTTDLESIIMHDDCDCESHCPRCSVSLILKEKGPKTVYTGDLTTQDPKIAPVHDTIPLLKLRDDESVELEAIAKMGKGLEHAKWQPTTSSAYKYYPVITIDTEKCEACAKCAEECPRGVLEFDEKKSKIMVVDPENCNMCKTCMKDCEVEAITVEGLEDKFIFVIETDGSLKPEEVIGKACDILALKSENIIKFTKGE